MKQRKPAVVSLSVLLTAAVAVPSAATQQPRVTPQAPGGEACPACFAHFEFPPAPDADARDGIHCGGQYECIEYGRLTETEARTARGYPRPVERGIEQETITQSSRVEPRGAPAHTAPSNLSR